MTCLGYVKFNMINEENKIKHKEEAKKDFENTNYYKEFESKNLNNNEI